MARKFIKLPGDDTRHPFVGSADDYAAYLTRRPLHLDRIEIFNEDVRAACEVYLYNAVAGVWALEPHGHEPGPRPIGPGLIDELKAKSRSLRDEGRRVDDQLAREIARLSQQGKSEG